jgi:hypothetical protein
MKSYVPHSSKRKFTADTNLLFEDLIKSRDITLHRPSLFLCILLKYRHIQVFQITEY